MAVGRQLLSDHAKLEKTCSPALLGLAKEQFTWEVMNLQPAKPAQIDFFNAGQASSLLHWCQWGQGNASEPGNHSDELCSGSGTTLIPLTLHCSGCKAWAGAVKICPHPPAALMWRFHSHAQTSQNYPSKAKPSFRRDGLFLLSRW